MNGYTITIAILAIAVLVLAYYCDVLTERANKAEDKLLDLAIDFVDSTIENDNLQQKIDNLVEANETLMLLASNNFNAALVQVLEVQPAEAPVSEWQTHVDEALAVGNE